MRGRLLLNGLLLLAVGLLAAWIYRGMQETAESSVNRLDTAAVERIEVQRRDGARLVFNRTGNGWRMREPRELPASEHHIGMLLRFLQLPVTTRYPVSEIDLASTGLAKPLLVLRFDGQRYQFGGQDPLSLRRYLLHEGEVLLVQEGVSAISLSPWWNFIDRKLLSDGEPISLTFADGRPFQPDDLGAWQRQWQQGQAAIVVPQTPGSKGEAFELELASGERVAWQWLEGEQPTLLRPDLGLAYQISQDLLSALLGRL